MVRSQRPSGIRGIRFPSKTHGHAPVCRPRIETISKAHGFPPRTVAHNSLKPAAKKDRDQEILLFPVLHPSPVPQPLPHEQRRGPPASEKPSMSPALSSSPIKVFGKDGGSLRGEGKPFGKKGSPLNLPPSFPKTFIGKDDGAGDIVGLPLAAGPRRCSCGKDLRHGKAMKDREQEHFLLPAFLLRALGC